MPGFCYDRCRGTRISLVRASRPNFVPCRGHFYRHWLARIQSFRPPASVVGTMAHSFTRLDSGQGRGLVVVSYDGGRIRMAYEKHGRLGRRFDVNVEQIRARGEESGV